MFLSSTFVSLQNTTWNKAYPWFLEKKVLVLLTILRDDYYFNLQPSLLLSHTIENPHKACSQKISPPLGELHSSIYLWNTTSKVAGLLTEISSEAAQRWYFSTCKFHWQSALSVNPWDQFKSSELFTQFNTNSS